MSLQDIIKQIQSIAVTESESRLAHAKDQAEAILSTAKSDATAAREHILSKREQQITDMSQRLHRGVRAANSESRARYQKHCLDGTQKQSHELLCKADKDQQTKLIKSLLASVPAQPGTITLGALTADLVLGMLENNPHKIADNRIDGTGGFMYESDTYYLDATYKNLVHQEMEATSDRLLKKYFQPQS